MEYSGGFIRGTYRKADIARDGGGDSYHLGGDVGGGGEHCGRC